MKVVTVWREGYKTLSYRYRVNSNSNCEFNLLSEVGAPWQQEARNLAQKLVPEGHEIRQVELDHNPWYVDAIVKETE